MERKLSARKHPRLKEYDYSKKGYYHITICTQNSMPILSTIVGRGLALAEVELTAAGRIAEEQLLGIQKRYESVKIDKYILMPTHIHAIIILGEVAEASLRPTLMDVVRVFKSMSTRLCNSADNIQGRKICKPLFMMKSSEMKKHIKIFGNI